jgi:hypothetical protein
MDRIQDTKNRTQVAGTYKGLHIPYQPWENDFNARDVS